MSSNVNINVNINEASQQNCIGGGFSCPSPIAIFNRTNYVVDGTVVYKDDTIEHYTVGAQENWFSPTKCYPEDIVSIAFGSARKIGMNVKGYSNDTGDPIRSLEIIRENPIVLKIQKNTSGDNVIS